MIHPDALTWHGSIEPGWAKSDLVLITQIDGGMGRRLTTEADLNALGFYRKPETPTKPRKRKETK